MEQNPGSENPMGFWGQTAAYIIVAVLIAVGIIYLTTRNKGGEEGSQNTNQQTQTGDNQNSNQNQDQNQNGQNSNTQGQVSGNSTGQNISATGVLRYSDDSARGNLMVESNRGKIYIFTKRDFTSQIGQEVTLNASGDIKNFVFLGFNESMGSVDNTARGGASDEDQNVSFTGTLKSSDNQNLGNYMITSASGKVYLKSAHDYSSKLDSTVTLSAVGSLQSFTNATLN